MTVDDFLRHAEHAGWEVRPPETAILEHGVSERAPEDLRAFLERCGGVRCAGGIVVGRRIVPAQPETLGESDPSDRSVDWFVIAEDSDASTAERVVIDLNAARLGRCYEAFWDVFGVPGSMPIVARSFTEFLDRLRRADGVAFWSSEELGLGDAYD